ncbi:undecaprenyldiphospho-muramoylpentapeptide beta-N-acetylglucosaminyltransferase [Bacillus lacus]|uniref:UDP-N-acetylglucosamine--N-acetylmuramyl-(pentapeptide) pyrophosphoryl-undecaprenol N-acetylglucosamine transferase n=1 Tax=Metabacillus lacus TaxID=1983721 RepID=A0A7X2LYE3_9BACI|nr:undecaprenyldiphospho-muramoylpentapeptide beta-N-acetylglucosaminyltransferase [Metabacillus lacus]MRX70807.1 undecaprenyldiphospho-muramoylpentapeptide beta-N-acetylglucosaminyltransferase [Metabacillus lacus]
MKVVVSGGGTGGHIYPALALINEMKKEDQEAEFLYIGTEKGLEKKIVGREGIPFQSIEITGFKRSISFENARTIFRFLKGVNESKKMLKEYKPDVVIGTGGYVCGPVVYAASKLKIPTIIHEQNSIPGLTNKFLARYVDKVAVCFEEAKSFFPSEKTVLTGNPRASEVIGVDGSKGKASAGLHPQKNTVLIFGGSRGAKAINDAVLAMLNNLGKREYQVLYITGEVHYETVMNKAKKAGIPDNVHIKPFIHNMPEVLAGVELIVSRAGATSLAEITALGLPSILVPSPHVTANHQEKNARALSDHGAAVLLLESELNNDNLLKKIDDILLNQEELQHMQQASRKLGMPDAARRLSELMRDLTNK